ncbi:EthD family reductase [Neobacillus vireti]|uniref:EthD family reductase n=1 Tax=Neobacillus vireti TaxID=220686 RepID=UPI002FFDEBE4
MAKILVQYEMPKNQVGFERHYFDVHIPLAKKLPNLKNVSVSRVLQSQNTEANLFLIGELEFEDINLLNEALVSEAGQEVQKDGFNLLEFLHRPPAFIILE